jgi:hypothetical protein
MRRRRRRISEVSGCPQPERASREASHFLFTSRQIRTDESPSRARGCASSTPSQPAECATIDPGEARVGGDDEAGRRDQARTAAREQVRGEVQRILGSPGTRAVSDYASAELTRVRGAMWAESRLWREEPSPEADLAMAELSAIEDADDTAGASSCRPGAGDRALAAQRLPTPDPPNHSASRSKRCPRKQ